jgi:TolB-like protein/Tfp pilus assembly protein PilF
MDRPPPPHDGGSAARGRWRWAVLALVAVSLATIAWNFRPSASDVRITSLAVLPLAYRSTHEHTADHYLADGMTEALIAELARLDNIRVISETSSRRFANTTATLPTIARELGVDGIVEGSVFREGNVIRVTVQLIHGRTDSHVWSQTYTRGFGSLLALQNDMAASIVSELGARVASRAAPARSIDLEAYRLYVLGHRLAQRETEPELQAAMDHYQRALHIEPEYARAYWGIAEAWIALGSWAAYLPPRESLPKAKAAALRAIELDESLAEAHSALAFVTEVYDWDLPAAEASYRRALSLSPNDALTHRRFSLFLNRTRRPKLGVEHAQRAFDLDPLSPENAIGLGQWLFARGDREAAVAAIVRATEVDPSHFHPWVHLAELYKHMGDRPRAIAAAERGLTLSQGGGHAAHMLASVHARFGERATALAVMEPFERPASRINPYDLGMFFLEIGEHDKALHWLQASCEARSPQMAFFHLAQATPAFEAVRKNARFAKLRECATTGLKPIASQ